MTLGKGSRVNLPKQQGIEKNIQNETQDILPEFIKCTKKKYQIKQKYQKLQKPKQVVQIIGLDVIKMQN